jgi:hypothetical protein
MCPFVRAYIGNVFFLFSPFFFIHWKVKENKQISFLNAKKIYKKWLLFTDSFFSLSFNTHTLYFIFLSFNRFTCNLSFIFFYFFYCQFNTYMYVKNCLMTINLSRVNVNKLFHFHARKAHVQIFMWVFILNFVGIFNPQFQTHFHMHYLIYLQIYAANKNIEKLYAAIQRLHNPILDNKKNYPLPPLCNTFILYP